MCANQQFSMCANQPFSMYTNQQFSMCANQPFSMYTNQQFTIKSRFRPYLPDDIQHQHCRVMSVSSRPWQVVKFTSSPQVMLPFCFGESHPEDDVFHSLTWVQLFVWFKKHQGCNKQWKPLKVCKDEDPCNHWLIIWWCFWMPPRWICQVFRTGTVWQNGSIFFSQISESFCAVAFWFLVDSFVFLMTRRGNCQMVLKSWCQWLWA